MKIPLPDYNTSNMTVAHAVFLVNIGKQVKSLSFEENANTFSELWLKAMQFLQDNKLTNTAFYTELKKKQSNLSALNIDNHVGENVFDDMKGVIDLHSVCISFKFGLPYL